MRKRDKENVSVDISEFAREYATDPQEYERADKDSFDESFVDFSEEVDDQEDQEEGASSSSKEGTRPKINAEVLATTIAYFIAVICGIIIDFLFCLVNKQEAGSYTLSKKHIDQSAQVFAEILQEYGLDDLEAPKAIRLLMIWADGSKRGIQDTVKTVIIKPKHGENKETSEAA